MVKRPFTWPRRHWGLRSIGETAVTAGDENARADDFRDSEGSDTEQLTLFLRRQWKVIATTSVLGLLWAAGHALITIPTFTSTAVLFVDNRRVHAVRDSYDSPAADLASSYAANLQQILSSDRIALAVARKMQLQKLPGSDHAWHRAAAIEPVGPENENGKWSDDEIDRDSLDRLRSGLTLRRVGSSQVFEISYTATDAAAAARIANAFADAYVANQLDNRLETTSRASEWLEQRLSELKQAVILSEQTAQNFRSDNGLTAIGIQSVDEYRLGDLSSQLSQLRSETTRLGARYERLKAIIDNQQTDAVVSETFGSATISQLKAKYLVAVKSEREHASRLGSNHAVVGKLRAEIGQYTRLMFEELGRIAESYKTELEIGRAREQALSKAYDEVVGKDGKTVIALRDLERVRDTYRTLYSTFLQRHQEAIQEVSFPLTNIRVISRARPSRHTNGPREIYFLALSLLIGGVAGVGIGVLRDRYDRSFRTSRQVREELGMEFLGMLPKVGPETPAVILGRDRERAGPDDPPPAPLEKARSHYAETMNNVGVAVNSASAASGSRIVGITSIHPAEGKTVTATRLAFHLARQGNETLLIDADLRNRGLTLSFAPTAQRGIAEAMRGETVLNDLLLRQTGLPLSVLPAEHDLSAALTPSGVDRLLGWAAQRFSHIVLDLPPLGLSADALAVAAKVDAFVLVMKWGECDRKGTRTLLASARPVQAKCIGAVLNLVDLSKLGLYEASGSRDYYRQKYASYC
jgi:succinoglycan biosynthesis transport protein ExoP